VNQTVEAAWLYLVRKNKVPLLMHNMGITHGIMYMTGYLAWNNSRICWERGEDTMDI
jgi:1-deoxy-D-xylulose 5-phosphate reductoisomerase